MIAFLWVVGRVLSIERLADDAVLLEAVDDEVLERIVAQHGREGDVGAGGAQVLGDDRGAADEVDAVIVAHADGVGVLVMPPIIVV